MVVYKAKYRMGLQLLATNNVILTRHKHFNQIELYQTRAVKIRQKAQKASRSPNLVPITTYRVRFVSITIDLNPILQS